MNRYIEVSKAMELCNEFYFSEETCSVKGLFDSAPSIDICFCKECKYCVNGQCWKSDGLDKLDGNVADDDFCSRGEREGE